MPSSASATSTIRLDPLKNKDTQLTTWLCFFVKETDGLLVRRRVHLLASSGRMNAFYVTVSIPLLLVLAGFNHAHGLTTFGKSTSQNHQPTNLAKPKECNDQSDCTLLKETTCVQGKCLCGNNRAPDNGECKATLLGPNHKCSKNEDCVDNADCIPVKDVTPASQIPYLRNHPEMNVCRCQEGYAEVGATCGESGEDKR